MRFYSQDDYRTLNVLSGILDGRRQSELVATEVEHYIPGLPLMIQVRGPECSADIRKRTPSRPFHDVHPASEGAFGLRMLLPEALQRQFADYPYVYIMYTGSWQVKRKLGEIRWDSSHPCNGAYRVAVRSSNGKRAWPVY